MNKRCSDHLDYESVACEGCMAGEIADLRKLAAVVSSVPCCVCQGPVVEFVRSNEEWNATMRPDGLEHDKEYLCASCYMNALAARAESAEAALAESERAGERLGELLADWQHWYKEDVPRMTRMQLEAKTDAALAEWRARKGGEAVAKKPEHPYSPPSQEDLWRMRDANTPKMPRQDDRPMRP